MSILSRLIDPANGSLNRSAAEAILQFRFSDEDQQRISTLAEQSNDGQLGEDEAREYDAYVAAAELLALLQSKARLSLKQQTSAA
jgi:hypothetical protein